MSKRRTATTSAMPLAACVSAAVLSGTRARMLLHHNAASSPMMSSRTDSSREARILTDPAATAAVPQFPCVLTDTGQLNVTPAYMNAVNKRTALVLPWRPDTPLLSKAALMKRLGIFVHEASKVITNSSHGEVWFGNIKAAKPDGTPAVVPVAIKFMPVSIEDDGYDAGMQGMVSNSAYVDPFISWMGSQLVARQESCAFAQLYGTFVCRGVTRHLGSEPVSVPLVAMVSEELGVKLDEVIISYLVPGAVQWEKLMALIVQAMVALAQAHAMTFVHNDAHMGNFLVAKTCPRAGRGMYYNINDVLLRVPADHRVVLMDFGRSTVAELDCSDSMGHCRSRPAVAGKRIQASEVEHRFGEWQLNDPSADVTHFFAMLLLCQETPDLLVTESSRPDAPPLAKALISFMRRVLVCGTSGKDMFTAYNACNTEELKGQATGTMTSCGKDLVHELRAKDARCGNLLPIDFLTDPVVTKHFIATEPIPPPPEAVLYTPTPPSLRNIMYRPPSEKS